MVQQVVHGQVLLVFVVSVPEQFSSGVLMYWTTLS